MSKLIYIADDEKNIRELLYSFLVSEGYRVNSFEDGDKLLDAFLLNPADMVILDLMMPGTDGLSICSKLRQSSNVPIIIVSARDSEMDRITGITLGSDDYLTKPFSPMELVARVKALFRRLSLSRSDNTDDIMSFGNMEINTGTRDAKIGGKSFDTTPTELALLIYLMQNSSKAVSREELLRNVWKFEFDADTRATDDVIKRLRKKLTIAGANVKIESVWGFGFKLVMGAEHDN